MAIDQRSQIFELRDSGMSLRNIAADLGISLGKVQRELAKPAREVQRANGQVGGGGGAQFEPTITLDPEIRERQKQITLKRYRVQELETELREAEARQRIALLTKGTGGGGGDAQVAALLLAEVGRLRDEIRERPGRDSGSLMSQLSELKTLGNTIASFAPPTAPSSPAEVEFKVALARINLEEQRIAADREKEIGLRAAQVASENMRNDAIAKFIESFGPMLASVAQKWLEDQKPTPAPAPALPAAPATPTAAEVEGLCPTCGSGLAMTPGTEEKCPGCGALLTVAEGQIVAAGATRATANGHGGPQQVPRVAS